MKNDYKVAKEVEGSDLFVVQLQNGKWTIADGPGTIHSLPDEIDLAGWHLPVKFDAQDQVIAAIKTGPHCMFDITEDATWTKHAVKCGGVFEPNFVMGQ